MLTLNLNEKFSEPTRSMNSERKHAKPFTPLTIIGEGRCMIFPCWGFASELFTTVSGFDVIRSASIGSVCDSSPNRFFYVNNFLFLLIFMVRELGSEKRK